MHTYLFNSNEDEVSKFNLPINLPLPIGVNAWDFNRRRAVSALDIGLDMIFVRALPLGSRKPKKVKLKYPLKFSICSICLTNNHMNCLLYMRQHTTEQWLRVYRKRRNRNRPNQSSNHKNKRYNYFSYVKLWNLTEPVCRRFYRSTWLSLPSVGAVRWSHLRCRSQCSTDLRQSLK